MKHLIFLSLVCLAILLPPAVEGLFPVIAVALGVGALLIAKGIFWGAVIGALSNSGNQGRSYYYRTPHSYSYRGYGRRKRSALQDMQEGAHNTLNKDQWFTDVSSKDEDDCGKRMVCELTARHALNASSLAEDEISIVRTFSEKIDVKKGQVEFTVASKVGLLEGELRCAELYRRCNTATDTIMKMVRAEMAEINNKIATGPTSSFFFNRSPSGSLRSQYGPGGR